MLAAAYSKAAPPVMCVNEEGVVQDGEMYLVRVMPVEDEKKVEEDRSHLNSESWKHSARY